MSQRSRCTVNVFTDVSGMKHLDLKVYNMDDMSLLSDEQKQGKRQV